MQHGDLKSFTMTHQHPEARNLSLKKTRNPHGTLKTHVTPLGEGGAKSHKGKLSQAYIQRSRWR